MNSATRETIEVLVTTAPETLPPSIVELDFNTRKAVLIQAEWAQRHTTSQMTPAELADAGARLLAESRESRAQAAVDREVVDGVMAELLGQR